MRYRRGQMFIWREDGAEEFEKGTYKQGVIINTEEGWTEYVRFMESTMFVINFEPVEGDRDDAQAAFLSYNDSPGAAKVSIIPVSSGGKAVWESVLSVRDWGIDSNLLPGQYIPVQPVDMLGAATGCLTFKRKEKWHQRYYSG